MPEFPRRWGAYVLVRPLGAGGMGNVYLALNGKPGREKLCVVKRVVPDKLASTDRINRFRREAEIARALSHGAIAQTLAVDEFDGEPYIAQEFIDGRTITQLVSTAQSVGASSIPPTLAIHIVREIARALAYAHGAGVVHRDVAPDNVMVSFAGEVRLIDFGIARAAADPSLTEPGVVVGRWSYTAPEVLAGGRADRRADVYAAGVVLWELLTRRLPTFAETEAPSPPSLYNPELPSALDAVVLQAIAKDPAQRFASAEELQRALGPFLPQTFVGEQALRDFVGLCYDVEVQKRYLAEEVAEASPLLAVPSEAPAPPVIRRGHPRAGSLVITGVVAAAAVVFTLTRQRTPAPAFQVAVAPLSLTPMAQVPTTAAPVAPSVPAADPHVDTVADAVHPSEAGPRSRVSHLGLAPRRQSTGPAPAVLLDRANDSLQGGSLAAAERDARDALSNASTLQKARAHVILGKVLLLQGQAGNAAEEFTDAIELDPRNEAAAAALARLRRTIP